MNKATANLILNHLRTIIPNPKCELNYRNLFELLCAVMLSSQTTDKRVNLITPQLFSQFPDAHRLSHAQFDEVYPIIQSVGCAKNKTKNIIQTAKIIHEVYHDVVPNTLEELTKLPGVGRKTASVVLAEGYHIPAMPVDTHLERMAKRLGFAKAQDNVLKCEAAYCRYIPREQWIEAHHLILLFGRYYCKAQNPSCDNCQLKPFCKKKD